MSDPEFVIDSIGEIWAKSLTGSGLYTTPGNPSKTLTDLDKDSGPLHVLTRGAKVDVRIPHGDAVVVDVKDYNKVTGTVIENKMPYGMTDRYTVRIDLVVNPERVERA